MKTLDRSLALAGCLGLLLLLPATGCTRSSGDSPSAPTVQAGPGALHSNPDESGEAPEKVTLDFSLKSVDGGVEDLKRFEGEIRVVDFWATWCPPCRLAVPHLNEVYRKYNGRGVTVIGISVDDSPRVVSAFEKETPIEYLSLMSSEGAERAFGGIVGLPSTFILDREGKVYRSYVGAFPIEELEDDLEALMASK